MSERQIVACIPIPGLNEWAKDASSNEAKTQLYAFIFIIIINDVVIIENIVFF